MKTQEKKIIRTVLGDISSEDLGFTLPHEHLLLDFSFMFKPSQDKEECNKNVFSTPVPSIIFLTVNDFLELLPFILMTVP